jgi:hypothetical protein
MIRVPADATIGCQKYASAASGNAVLSACALSLSGHAQDIPGRTAGWLPPAAAEVDGCAGVHAASATARPTATPVTPATRPGRCRTRPRHDHGLAIAFPTDRMLADIDASLPAANRGVTAAAINHLFYNV